MTLTDSPTPIPTPITDAAERQVPMKPYAEWPADWSFVVEASVARQLEKALATEKARADALDATLNGTDSFNCGVAGYAAMWENRCLEAESERDVLRAKIAEYGAVAVQTVPGEHGDGVECPASPQHLRKTIDYLQSEWDGAEKRAAILEQENALLKAGRDIPDVGTYATTKGPQ